MSKTLIRWAVCADGVPLTWSIRGTRRECKIAAENTWKEPWQKLRTMGFTIQRVRITLETETRK